LALMCCAQLVGFSPATWTAGIKSRLCNPDYDECRYMYNAVFDAVQRKQARLAAVGLGAGVGLGGAEERKGEQEQDYDSGGDGAGGAGAGGDDGSEGGGGPDLDNILAGLDLDDDGAAVAAPQPTPELDFNILMVKHASVVTRMLAEDRLLGTQKERGKETKLWTAWGKSGGAFTKDCYTKEEVIAHILLRFPELLQPGNALNLHTVVSYVKPGRNIVEPLPISAGVMAAAQTLVANPGIWVKQKLTREKLEKIGIISARGAVCWRLKLRDGSLTQENVLTKLEVAVRVAFQAEASGRPLAQLLWSAAREERRGDDSGSDE
jgi:hypothetical protein